MNIFDTYTHDLLHQLNLNEVPYIVVGGYAVNYHGYRRTTGDIDIWIKPSNENSKTQLLIALKNLGITEDKLQKLSEIDFTLPTVFVDGKEPYKIDFMTRISGVNFEEAWDKKIIAELDGLKIPFIHLHHLILSKISNNRTKDKLDVEELQKIQELRKNL
ncbi:MAG: hypothetical protein EBZ58_09000 [Bacteroidetes bacterium]|jgi:hypothetical protein|nr:hypothetical protein [Bacteroidota bacterium]